MSYIRVHFEHGMQGMVYLGLCLDFIVKNQLPGQTDQSSTIPPISTIVGVEDDGALYEHYVSFHLPLQD